MTGSIAWRSELHLDVATVNTKFRGSTTPEKYEALHFICDNAFQLLKCSRRPSDAKLFQHLILLLKLGGVKDEVFLRYVEAAVDKLKEYFTTPCEALRGKCQIPYSFIFAALFRQHILLILSTLSKEGCYIWYCINFL